MKRQGISYASELLRAPEGAVGNVDIDGQRLDKLVVKDGAKRGKDALEGLDTSTKVEALLAALEKRLLDLSVLLGRILAHQVVEEIDRVDALG